jgi:hypothetical protein
MIVSERWRGAGTTKVLEQDGVVCGLDMPEVPAGGKLRKLVKIARKIGTESTLGFESLRLRQSG